MGLACGSARREKMEERGNEWGWFSQMKTTLKRCGVWRNHEKEESLKGKAAEKDQTARETSGNCFSLEESTLLEKIEDVYENKISLRRVYEVKKVISGGKPGREEFNNHVRKLQHLWVELQGLRSHVDGDTTQEQQTVLKLLASMESSYGWLVEMVLRGEQLPEMEKICGLIRRAYEIMRDDERLTMSRSESSWKPTGSRSESFQKLTMSRSEGSWRLTGSRSEGFRKKRRCRMLSKASINIGKGRKRVVGECSYSAYMGESVEDSGVLREQEKGSGADDRITRKEWRVFMEHSSNPTSEAERTTPLDHERGNGTESHEQVQNQEDSGQHNQEVTQEVESGAQSSGDGQRESTGSDESGTQSSGDWEVDHDGSNESGAQSRVSRSLSAASCVTIRSTYLEKLESFDSFLQGLSHLFQSIILGSHQVVSEQLWKGSTMAGDQKGKLTKEERLLLKSMNAQMQQMLDTNMGEFRKELRQKFLQQTDDLRQQNKKRMDKQKLEPRPPDSVPNKSSKHKWYKEEEAGRGQQSYKQPAHTLSRPHQASRTPKSNIHSSYNQIVTKSQLYVFTGEGDYLKWERTMEKWLCYNKILKRDALAYVMSQLKGNIYKWLLQEEDDRRYYKEPAITTWEDLKFLLRKKYASKGHTSLKSPMKEVTSSKAVTCYIKEKTVKRSWFSEKDKKELLQVIMDVEKQVKRTYTPRPSTETKHQEPVTTVSELKNAGSDSAATIQEVQTETSMQKEKSETEQECSLFLSQSELNFNNSCDELTCLKPVQPSRIVSVSQVAKEDSAEKEPESTTQEEQQKNLQTESAHESLSYDLQEHCKEFNMVASVPRMFVKVLELELKHSDFCLKPCDSFVRTEERSFVTNFHVHKLILDNSFVSAYELNEPKKLQEPKLHQSDFRFKCVKSAKFSKFELDNDSKHVGWFFDDILVYNTFFDKPAAQLKLDITDSECVNLNLNDIWVYITSFDMITHLTCPKRAEKCTGKKRGYTDESLAKLEMQQSNLGSCLAVNFDIGAVRGSYLSNPKELSNKLNCYGNYTHQGLTSNWNLVESFSYERVMDSTSRVILCLLCLNFSEYRTSQSYIWRPGEHAKVTNHVFKSSFIDYTDMMHLFLSKESCADYMEALKHAKTKNKHEEDKRFKPPDLSQERHQDVTCFILIKEAPPDATYKPKPIKYNFGIILLLYDVFACVHLSCFNVSGLSNASGVRRAKWISPFYLIEAVSDNAYQRGLQGNTDLRTNLFEVGGDDMIMESTKDWKHEPEPEELVAEDATLKNIWKQEEYIRVSRSLSAASCVTIRSTYLEKLESFDSFLQGLSHLFQSIILGSHHSLS
ncbi:hypothetical protein IGI04_042758 [Brassica rapa subsp. trilocularis]|uniref:Uncharacterized protein n=1 Tax=Brassica rapa subsp. trilocularis TaxID=1813537 RepID=A0ABQ7KIJ0_BRACM|nr:hypothetical protein IGI04_042758 [Brassica rapa subsp. trilocularis]